MTKGCRIHHSGASGEQGHLNTFLLAVWCTSALRFVAMYCQIPTVRCFGYERSWPPSSLVMNPCTRYVWDHHKHHVNCTNADTVQELQVVGAASETTGNTLCYAADLVAHVWQVRQVEESCCTVHSHSCILQPTNYRLNVT